MADSDTTRSTPRKIFRRPEDGHIAGVCAGLAEYFDVDPALVRIATVVLAFTGPGIPAYVLAWIFLPAQDGSAGATERPSDRRTQVIGIVLIGLALSVLWGDWWSPARRWMVPVGLIGVGAWLLLRRDQDEWDGSGSADPRIPPAPQDATRSTWSTPPGTPTSAAPAPPVPAGAAATPDTASDPETETSLPASTSDGAGEGEATGTDPDATAASAGGGPVPPAWGPSGPAADQPIPHPPVPLPLPRRRRFVGPLVFGALLVWGGVAWLADVDVQDGLAIGLCILGGGFVVGAFVGGSRALIFPALVVAAALMVTSVVDIPWGGGIGNKRWEVPTPLDLRDRYELGIGEGTLDLRNLDLSGRSGRTYRSTVDLGVGHLVVLVPMGAALRIDGEVGMGDIAVLGRRDEGIGLDMRRTVRGDTGYGTLALDLNLGVGEMEVRRAP